MSAKRSASAVALVLSLVIHLAGAVSLSPNGVGEVLIYPYYTVNNSQDTLISVVNASAVGKAVSVRFLEGYNGRDTLDFDLYLSPHDVWTAAISQTADDGGGALKTSDVSCTFPIIPSGGVALRTAAYDGTGSVPADGGPQDITRTREGFVELIMRGDVDPASALAGLITHVDGVPPGCASIDDAAASAGIVTPTDGIYGSAAIVNVGEGTFFPYNADAIRGFSDVPLYSPDTQFPSLQDANSSGAVNGVATAYVSTESGVPIALDYAFGIDAVSAIFMADTLYNEYVVAASLGANTDWVVTFPTKAYYVDSLYGAVPFAPFEEAFVAPGQAAVAVAGTVFDREEGNATFGGPCNGFCPPPSNAGPANLPYEVNVIPIVNAVAPTLVSGVFGSNLAALAIAPSGDDGHIALDLTGGDSGVAPGLPGGIALPGGAVRLVGLPATGFMAYNVINAHAQPGLLANYSGAFHHRSSVSCVGILDGCNPIITGAGTTP